MDAGLEMACSIKGKKSENIVGSKMQAATNIDITAPRINGMQMIMFFFQVLKPPLNISPKFTADMFESIHWSYK